MLPIMIQTMHPGKFNINEGHPVTTKTETATKTPDTGTPATEMANISTASKVEHFDGQFTDPLLNHEHHCNANETTEHEEVQSARVKDLHEQISKHSADKSEPVSGVNKPEDERPESQSDVAVEPSAASGDGMSFNHELIRQTHSKMANKFSELESETGIRLLSSHDNHCKQTNVNADADVSAGESVIICNSNNANNNKQPPRPSIHTNGSVGQTSVGSGQATNTQKDEVHSLREDLRLKNEMVEKLSYIRTQVESELQDLTASLFEEANKMVQDANVLRQKAEQEYRDTTMRMEVLSAENVALKNLVIHSTPSTPKKNVSFLHAAQQKKRSTSKPPKGLPSKSPSNYELGASEIVTNNDSQSKSTIPNEENNNECDYYGDIDPVYYQEFKEWHKSPNLDPSRSAFMKRIYDEEIYTVFNFRNKNLTSAIIRAIECNSLTVERIKGDAKDKFPRKCKLLDDYRPCIYRMRVDEGPWHMICSLSRERITTVCDLLCYLRYVKDGLVKSEPKEIYWQIMRRRHSISKARLGFLTI